MQGSGLLDVEEAGVCRTAAGLVISYMGQEASGLKGSVRDLCRERGLDESLFLAVLRQLDFERTQFLKNIEDYSEGQKRRSFWQPAWQRRPIFIYGTSLSIISMCFPGCRSKRFCWNTSPPCCLWSMTQASAGGSQRRPSGSTARSRCIWGLCCFIY